MTRKKAGGILAALLALAILAGCGGAAKPAAPAPAPAAAPAPAPAPTPPPAPQFKVGMVTDVGGLGDKSFNDSANAGLKRAESELKAKVAVVESKRQEDYEPNLTTLKDQGYDLVWAIGFLMTDSVAKVAAKFPNQKFAIIDSVVDKAPNVANVTFKEEEGSFLVGVIAAKATKVKKVGFVGGMDVALIRKFEAGFRAGVKAVDPTIVVSANYTGAFDSPQKGKESALTLFGQGADVIYAAAGACGTGVIEAAKDKGLYAIGVDSDQNSLAPQNVISSMMKRVDNAVFMVSQQAANGKFAGGSVTVLGLKENGVGPSPTTLWDKAPGAKELVDKWTAAIVGGKATIPTDIKGFEAWTVPSI